MVHLARGRAPDPAYVVLQGRHRAPGEVFRQEERSLRQHRSDERDPGQQALHGLLQGEADQRRRILRGPVQPGPEGRRPVEGPGPAFREGEQVLRVGDHIRGDGAEAEGALRSLQGQGYESVALSSDTRWMCQGQRNRSRCGRVHKGKHRGLRRPSTHGSTMPDRTSL